MKVSLQWINELLRQELSALEVTRILEKIGFQVENCENKSENIQHVVVAEVLKVEPHPHADTLSLCHVSDGRQTFSVVCGAPNVSEGIKAPFARVGAVLPGGFKIKKATIRGVESAGMLVSEKELDMGEYAEGIMHLSSSAKIGEDICKTLRLDDTLIEFEVTPNRPDVLSHIGIVREIAAQANIRLILPKSKSRFLSRAECTVLNEDIAGCKRYTAQIIEGVKVGPAPDFVIRRLRLCGIRPINNIVDITNYVLLETGQPLHAFDYDLLKGGHIRVRRARNESIRALDGKNYDLPDGALIIADSSKVIALAGIIGSEETAVSEHTKNILLESAYFDPQTVRRTAQRLHISTESSYRFERGIDIESVQSASLKAVDMILMCAGGEKTQSKEVYPVQWEPSMIELRPERVNAILGSSMSKQTMAAILNRLNFELQNKSVSSTCMFKVPSYRVDIKEEIDLIEEIARHHGYDAIETHHYTGKIMKEQLPETWHFKESIRSILNGLGLFEAYNYGFMSIEDPGKLMMSEDKHTAVVMLKNPIAQNMTALQNTLLPGLLRNAFTNTSQKNLSTRLYEIGTVFSIDKGDFSETGSLAIFIMGQGPEEIWTDHAVSADYGEISGIVSVLCKKLRIETWNIVPAEAPYLQPGQSAEVRIAGNKAGTIGRIHPRVLDNYGINETAFVIEIDLTMLFQASTYTKKYTPLPKFPAIRRDFSFSFNTGTTWEHVRKETLKSGKPIIESVMPFDRYEGKQYDAGKYGLSFSIILRSKDKTLTDQDADAVQKKIIQNLTKKFGAELRTA